MDEPVGEAGPCRNFGKQIGDPDARQQAIEAGLQCLRLVRGRAPQRRDGQTAVLDRGVGQRSLGRGALHLVYSLAQPVPVSSDPVGRTAAHGEAELPFGVHGREGRSGQEIVAERAIGAASVHPDRARGEPVAQMDQHRDLPGTPVERTIGR